MSFRLLIILILHILLTTPFKTTAQVVLLGWDTNGNAGNEVSLNADINNSELEISTLTRGDGINASSLDDAFSSNNWNASSLAEAITNDEYYQLTVEPKSNQSVGLNQLIWNFRRSSTGPDTLQWHYSIDGANFFSIDSPIEYTGTQTNGQSIGPVELTCIKDLQDVTHGQIITLRLYAWGASGATGSGAIGRLSDNDLEIIGEVNSGTLIAVQDFETSPRTPTLTFSNTNGDFSSGLGLFPAERKAVGCDRGFEANDEVVTLTTDPIDTRNYTDVNFAFRLASFSGTSGNGADGSDEVIVEISDDNGSTWSEELVVNGNNNARWSFEGGNTEASASYDGDNTPATFQPSGGGDREDDNDAFTFININGLPNVEFLQIRVTMENNDPNEFWVIDDLKVFGSCIPPSTQVSNFSASTVAGNSSTLSWTRGTGDEVLVIASESRIKASPINEVSYTANTVFGSGDEIFNNEFIVYRGTASGATVTGLSNGGNYFFKAFEVNTTDFCYNQSGLVAATPNGLQISTLDTKYTIDFDNTVPGVNESQFNGSGLSPSPSSGQLNSNAWKFEGFDDGDSNFGGNFTTGDFARGDAGSGVTTGGLYAFESTVGNFGLGVQPGGSDFAPGNIILRIQNQSGNTVNSILLAYTIYVRNDQNWSTEIKFSYGFDSLNFNSIDVLDLFTEETANGSVWEKYYRVVELPELSLAPGALLYLKWESDDKAGSGSRDEFALDDIEIIGNASSTYPSISGEVRDVHIAGRAQLDGNLIVQDSIIISDSILFTISTDTVVLSSTAIINETGNGYLEGNLKTTRTINQNSNPSFNLLGGIGFEVNPLGNDMGETTIIRVTGDRLNGEAGGNPTQSLLRYFQIDPETNTSLNANIRFTYNDRELVYLDMSMQPVEVNDPDNDLALYKRPIGGAVDEWEKLNGTINTSSNLISVSGIDSFSEIALADQTNAPLPVTWLNFIAYEDEKNQVVLEWSTASEENNDFFTIQKSRDGHSFQPLGTLPGAGTTTVAQAYRFTDTDPYNGINYYRIKQTDFDGSADYSELVSVFVDRASKVALNISPNPTTDIIQLRLEGLEDEKFEMVLIDLNGRLLGQYISKEPEISLSLSELPKGVYILKILAKERIYTRKLIKN